MSRSATLEVHLPAIVRNYQLLRARHHAKRCAAVVKANAYGLGVIPVAKALAGVGGCEEFFVATLDEALQLRAQLWDKVIYVFSGVAPHEVELFFAARLIPVLNSPQQVECWVKACAGLEVVMPSALHVDTGMCRLGLSHTDLLEIDQPQDYAARAGIRLIMTHLACASEPQHPLNAQQVQRFVEVTARFPDIATSMANSSGLFLPQEYHADIGRPGCALYGITPNPQLPNPMQPVVTLRAPILQVREVDVEHTIGYGATCEVHPGQKVAVAAMGYADGLHRAASNKLAGWIGDIRVPMLGRVSMDVTCYDVSHVPQDVLNKEAAITLIGVHQTVDDVAEAYGSIGYEVLTSLGARVLREYITF
jgi:alanine racemase